MDLATISPLISSIFVFLLSLLVLTKGKKNRVNYTFFAFSFLIVLWMFGTFMMFWNKGDLAKILFWDKFIYFSVSFIPVVMLHFGYSLINKDNNTFLYIGYAISFVFACLVPTDLFINDVFLYEWGAHSKAQFFHHFFLLYFTIYLSVWFILVYQSYQRTTSPAEKEKIKYSFLAFFILAIMGSLGYLPAYGISIYPFAYISGLIFSIIISYAIIAHRLMDIRIALRKSSIVVFTYGFLAGEIILLNYLFEEYHIVDGIYTRNIAILFIVSTGFPYVRKFFYRFANKYFFSALYDAQDVISTLSTRLRLTLNISDLYQSITDIFFSTFHPKAVGMLAHSVRRQDYEVIFNQNFSIGRQKRFPGDPVLSEFFISQNQSIVVDELKPEEFRSSEPTISILKKLGVSVLTPLNYRGKTIGLFALGAKESGDSYNDDDLIILSVIASQTAAAIDNALLYEKVRKLNEKMGREVDRATADLRSANTELLKLDQAKSEFVSMASHQLLTPLTVIKGYISMLQEGAFGQLTPGEQDSLFKVYESNERLINLIENLLNVNRIESGRLEYKFKVMPLTKVLDNLMEELKIYADKKGLKLNYNKPSEPLSPVKMDEEKMRQVMMNLIDNSIKYTKQGSVTVSLKEQAGRINFTVSDTGMGIRMEDLPNLFKKFSRGTGVSQVHTEGTGLGLYVAKMMLNAHGGDIWAESEGENRGSRFNFWLPVT